MSVRDGTGPRSQEGCEEERETRAWWKSERQNEVAEAGGGGGGGGRLAAERRATAQWGKLIAEIWVQCKRVARLGLTGGL